MFQKGDPETKRAGGKGGTAVKVKYGHEFYTEIGRKGGQARWAKAREQVNLKNPLVVKTPEKQEN